MSDDKAPPKKLIITALKGAADAHAKHLAEAMAAIAAATTRSTKPSAASAAALMSG